jgi:hypothetical protein
MRLLSEPPFRLLPKLLLRYTHHLRAQARWDACDRPHYLNGLLYAADQAKREDHDAIAAIEFGVAEGDGLLALQTHAAAVEGETGVRIHPYGFDSGGGMPEGTGDYRDHPDIWQLGDYRMDVPALRAKLTERTTLVLGEVTKAVLTQPIPEPLGFMAMDLDYYSSTAAALLLLIRPGQQRLRRVAMYFDDLSDHFNHRWAGEPLAIEEFNAVSEYVKIDRWHGLASGRPFPDAPWLEAMYLAHDLDAIGRARLTRGPARMR